LLASLLLMAYCCCKRPCCCWCHCCCLRPYCWWHTAVAGVPTAVDIRDVPVVSDAVIFPSVADVRIAIARTHTIADIPNVARVIVLAVVPAATDIPAIVGVHTIYGFLRLQAPLLFQASLQCAILAEWYLGKSNILFPENRILDIPLQF
jgi:hypothetical protein